MTEHVLNFSIGLDDDGIRKAVQESAVREINESIKEDILNAIFKSSNYWQKATTTSHGEVVLDKDAELRGFVKDLVKETIEEHKDELLRMAASELVESFKKTKAWKEMATAAIKKEVEE